MTTHHQRQEKLDAATRQRLARLAAMPVDASRLERRLRAELGEAPAKRAFPLAMRTWGSLIAAMLVIVATLVFTVGTPTPVTAAPTEMLRLHRAMVTGEIPVTAASDETAVRVMVTSEWNAGDAFSTVPEDLARSCCLHSIGGRPLLGLLLDLNGSPVSVAMTDLGQLRPFDGSDVVRDGRRYVIHKIDGTSMAMVQVHDRILCFMGAVPTDELLDLAERALKGH